MAEYCEVVYPAIKGSYLPLECQDMTPGKKHGLFDKLNKDLGITGCFAVPVMHCPHAYALVIDGTPFGRAANSGDCRPSMQFAEAALDAGLLIHEATFEDGMEEEAVLK
jgi:ribonuclease Z